MPDHAYGVTPAEFDQVIGLIREQRDTAVNVYGPLFRSEESTIPKETGDCLDAIALSASASATVSAMEELRDLDLRPFLTLTDVPTAIFHAIDDHIISPAKTSEGVLILV